MPGGDRFPGWTILREDFQSPHNIQVASAVWVPNDTIRRVVVVTQGSPEKVLQKSNRAEVLNTEQGSPTTLQTRC